MNSNEEKLKNLVTTYIYDNRGMDEQEIDNIIDYFVHAPNFVRNPLSSEEIDNVSDSGSVISGSSKKSGRSSSSKMSKSKNTKSCILFTM